MKKILLLDDNEDILEVVNDVLAYENFEVKATTKSVEFMMIAERYQPDLIIVDYRLADGNGADLCRALKSNANLRHIPVILFSAYFQPGLNFMDFGCDAAIYKPFDIEELISTVNSLIHNSQLSA
ncbi:response regulator transcription factor [Mucilaginibacter pedocola]|uniref:Response regulatory domain-containing protein n=1 Tax=Mucilaginibacter pedocola TaxID=1792845 RepID=A0A1S9P6H6_9SPHI|nr:response regulator [Mucilaginibacter pedocola]OOQ56552.1 hypothetical protein BC343_19140 [Mucilaginibacter pedocola]